MTPADDLPPLPKLELEDSQYGFRRAIYYTKEQMRAYTIAARAKRDAEVDRLNRTLASIKESHVEAARIASERGEQLAAAEARVKELEHQLEIAEHDSVHQSQLYSEYAEEWTRERDTLQKRVAELEEKLIVMCVTQLKDEAINSIRLHWLHNNTWRDEHGYEYGVAKVKFGANGNPESVFWTLADHSDIDSAMQKHGIELRGLKAEQSSDQKNQTARLVPAPDPPAPAPEAEVIAQMSQLVNGAGEWITVTPELLRDWIARLSAASTEAEYDIARQYEMIMTLRGKIDALEAQLQAIKLQPIVGWLIPPKDSITLLESVMVAWRERAFEVSELIERPKCT